MAKIQFKWYNSPLSRQFHNCVNGQRVFYHSELPVKKTNICCLTTIFPGTGIQGTQQWISNLQQWQNLSWENRNLTKLKLINLCPAWKSCHLKIKKNTLNQYNKSRRYSSSQEKQECVDGSFITASHVHWHDYTFVEKYSHSYYVFHIKINYTWRIKARKINCT